MGKLKNRKDEVTGEMINGGGGRVVDWIWMLCKMTFKSGVVTEDWRPVMISQQYKGKGEKGRNIVIIEVLDC